MIIPVQLRYSREAEKVIVHMLGQRRQSLKAEEFLREPTPPSSWLGKAKYYYDLYNCRYFAPFLLLFLYSILGAWVFHLVEYENEKEMKVDLLLWYENELQKVKLPEALEWDMWGALFYVGTIFTTIGYGNIVPRTITGRALSVVYAIIGIPLVLAILSRFGQFLEHNIARVWLKHREKIKEAHKQTRKRISTRVNAETIPIWLALLICISWICACAGLFLIWEKRWTFFTSLYFFFISLSTIGLGDVVPDHPHMLILMFWLVIIGLSIVSMLLAVIQIKFEECLYNFMIRMQEEYQRNLANGLPLNHEEIRKRAMEDQPFLMKLFGPDLISDSQMEKIEEKAEQFERITRSLNNKNIQTEIPAAAIAETQVEKTANSIACDPMTKSDSSVVDGEQIPWSKDVSAGINEEHLTGRCADEERDSMSDATSLPLDSIRFVLGFYHIIPNFLRYREAIAKLRNTAVVGLSKQAKCVHVQTDIAQFQIDEIVLRLAALQVNQTQNLKDIIY
uniref:Ion_trans_2 domain-containing protein n=1 Tax=Angiostrongylus cantonensis TaxID=6313 RepID=A0A158PAX4_ANGCA